MKLAHIFLSVFLVSLVAHSVYWRYLDDSPDQQSWIMEMERFSTTALVEHRKSSYYGYPATTLLGFASLVSKFGIPPRQAFPGIMAVCISLPIAFSAMFCALLRPKTLWWVGAAGLMITSQLYYSSTPPSALVTVYVTSLFLYALYMYEHRKTDTATGIMFGSIAGISLATRLDISLVVLVSLCFFLVPIVKKKILLVLFSALCMFVVLNPYMRAFPVRHVQDIAHKITYHTTLGASSVFPVPQLLRTLPLSGMGLLASVLLFLFPNSFPAVVPRRFLALVLSMGVGVSALLVVFSSYHPVWYFYPMLQIFEVLFVLYLLHALAASRWFFAISSILAILIIGNSTLFFMKLFL